MKSTRKPSSHGEVLSRAQETTRILSLEAAVRDLLALERLRIESRERLELASMKEAQSADERRCRYYDTVAQIMEALPGLLVQLTALIEKPGFQAGYSGGADAIRHKSAPAPAPAPARASAEPTNNPPASEANSEPAPSAAAVANGVSPGHPLGHIYGNGIAGH